MSFLNRAGSGAAVDVGAVLDPSGAWEHITGLVTSGALVSLSRTRDAGAVGITVTVDGAYEREYCRSNEEACDFLAACLSYVNERPSAPPPPKAQRRGR